MLARAAPDPATFVEVCREWARTRPLQRAYTWLRDGEDEDAALTFGELDAVARSIAAELEARGLSGERALLMYSPGLHFIAAFLGCLYARVVAVPLNTPHNHPAAPVTLTLARHAAPAILLCDSALLGSTLAAHPLVASLPVLATDTVPLESGQGWRPSVIPAEHL